MAKQGSDEVWVQLATRVPKTLHRALKTHCVQSDVSVMEFIVQAITSALGSKSKSKRAA